MRIDVVMLTKNSNNKYFKKVLKSIKREIPLNELIVIDGFSSDGTVEMIKKYFKKLKIISTKASLGKCREIGIKNVTTKWFMFVDSDVELPSSFFKKIMKYLDWGDAIEPNFIIKFIDSNKQIGPERRRNERRGLCLATLIKKDIIKNIRIPPMKAYEDEFIRQYVLKKGGKWIKIKDPIVVHYRKSFNFNDGYNAGYYSGKYNLKPFWRVMGALVVSPSLSSLGQFMGFIKGKIKLFVSIFL